jgi:signal transduction histidine kinase
MPTFSGDDALRLWKEHAPDVPFIVVSGTRGEEHAVDVMRAGASDFIVKERLHRLAPVIERELHEAAARRRQRRTEQALADSQQQLRQAQKLEAVGRLAGGVAHDFNNLLAAILSYADIVLRDLPAGDSHRADMQEIKQATGRAAALTRQLLDFSRQQVVVPSIVNLNDVIRESRQLLQGIVGTMITVHTSFDQKLWEISGDPARLEQVLMNLAANARDAMPTGGTLRIQTSNVKVSAGGVRQPQEPGYYVRLDVTDNGTGISEDALPKIFEPFFTTKEDGKGTGLGLATVYGIVEQSGGAIFVDSRPGEGARFAIFFPRVTAH